MFSGIPKDFDKTRNLTREKSDAELLRIGIIVELDAINLYEQLAQLAER